MNKKLYTVYVFSKLATKRFFRDRLALFFGVLFPVIFLIIFGSFSSNSGRSVNFNVAFFNNSNSGLANQTLSVIKSTKIFKIDSTIKTMAEANKKLNQSQIDGIIVIPSNYGHIVNHNPIGKIQLYYSPNNSQTGQTMTALLSSVVGKSINKKYVSYTGPISVVGTSTSSNSLSPFDYTFSGLLGFSIIGIGIFGPVNVFPELKKQGILRRLHTTPLRVWQYFTSTMIAQAITGLVSLAVMFAVAIIVFHLKITGNYFSIAVFLAYAIVAILGLGLAIGGWAKNERQAAPLANIIVFPLLFLSGTFFPRYLMPHWLQTVTSYLPLTPIIDGARLLTTSGYSLFQIGPQIGLIGIWIIIVYVIAFRVFRWE